MDTDFKSAIIELVNMQSIIQITSCIWIDSEDPALSEVLSGVNLSLRNVPGSRREAFRDVIGESIFTRMQVYNQSLLRLIQKA